MKLNNQASPQARFFCPKMKELAAFVVLLLHSDRGVLNTESTACWICSSIIFTLWNLRIASRKAPSYGHACMSVAACSFIVDVCALVVPSMKAGLKLHTEASFSLNWEQTAHLRVTIWSQSTMSNFSHKEVLNVWPFSTTLFSTVALVTAHVHFLAGGPSVDDDLNDDDQVLIPEHHYHSIRILFVH